MKVLNFLNNYRYYIDPYLEFDKSFLLLSRLVFKLDCRAYWSSIVVLRIDTPTLTVESYLTYIFRKIRILEIFFKYLGFLIEFYLFKKLINFFRKFNSDFLYGKCDFTNREDTRALQNSFLPDIFLIILSFTLLLSLVKKNGRYLAFWIFIRKYNLTIIIRIYKDFFNMLSTLNYYQYYKKFLALSKSSFDNFNEYNRLL